MTHTSVQDNDVASQTMGLLSFFDGWLLARHQWIVQGMRSLITGETLPAVQPLPAFSQLPSDSLDLPVGMRLDFADESQRLETLWQKVVLATRPLPGLRLLQQLDYFQGHTERFMREAERASQTLWRDFSLRDPITGARTRLTLNTALREKQQATLHGVPSCIALIDQGGLQAVSERWCHSTSDTVLAMTAHLIQEQLRAGDMLFRFGAREWLIVLANTPLNHGEDIVARVCERVRHHAFAAPSGQIFHTDLDCGIAEVQDSETPDAWIVRVELARHAMKRSRRALNAAARAA